MAILNNIINLVACGASGVLGTGFKGCRPYFQKTKDLWFVPRGFVFDGTKELDVTYAQQLQAEGNLIVVKGITTFTDNSSDDQIETLEDGTKRVTTLGLYEFLVQFVNGLYFHTALFSLSSFGNYDVLYVDTAGNLLGTQATNGSLKGFSVGMLQGQRLTWATDTAGQREGLAFQLTERTELDENYVFIQNKNISFDIRTLEGVNEATLSYVNAPAAADTTLTVKVVTRQDGKPVSGIPFGDFQVTVNGVIVNPTAAAEVGVTGVYALTITALVAADVVDVRLYDVAEDRIGITLDGCLYKSETISATAV